MFKLATPYHLNRSPFRRATGVLHMLARDETIRRRPPAAAMDSADVRCPLSRLISAELSNMLGTQQKPGIAAGVLHFRGWP